MKWEKFEAEGGWGARGAHLGERDGDRVLGDPDVVGGAVVHAREDLGGGEARVREDRGRLEVHGERGQGRVRRVRVGVRQRPEAQGHVIVLENRTGPP